MPEQVFIELNPYYLLSAVGGMGALEIVAMSSTASLALKSKRQSKIERSQKDIGHALVHVGAAAFLFFLYTLFKPWLLAEEGTSAKDLWWIDGAFAIWFFWFAVHWYNGMMGYLSAVIGWRARWKNGDESSEE